MGVYEKRLVAREQELLLLLQLGIMIDSWTELGGWTAIVAGLCFGIDVGVAINVGKETPSELWRHSHAEKFVTCDLIEACL